MSATHNRVAPLFYDSPPKTPPARTLPPLPKTPAERQQALADATFSAVLALQGLLTSADPKVVIQAAGMILDLDKTQMRHRTQVCGTFTPLLDSVTPVSVQVPTPQPTPQPVEPKRDLSNPFVQYVLRVQKRLQAKLDEAGLDDDISWEEAEEVAVEEIQKERIRRDKLRAEKPPQSAEPPTAPAEEPGVGSTPSGRR